MASSLGSCRRRLMPAIPNPANKYKVMLFVYTGADSSCLASVLKLYKNALALLLGTLGKASTITPKADQARSEKGFIFR